MHSLQLRFKNSQIRHFERSNFVTKHKQQVTIGVTYHLPISIFDIDQFFLINIILKSTVVIGIRTPTFKLYIFMESVHGTLSQDTIQTLRIKMVRQKQFFFPVTVFLPKVTVTVFLPKISVLGSVVPSYCHLFSLGFYNLSNIWWIIRIRGHHKHTISIYRTSKVQTM